MNTKQSNEATKNTAPYLTMSNETEDGTTDIVYEYKNYEYRIADEDGPSDFIHMDIRDHSICSLRDDAATTLNITAEDKEDRPEHSHTADGGEIDKYNV